MKDNPNIIEIPVPVFDNTRFCSSWATAVTSAMTMTLSRWSSENINLSVQFLLDCDIIGDPCIDRPPLSAYEQFWRRYIPTDKFWRNVDKPTSPPSKQLTQDMCDNYRACYPGMSDCTRKIVMTGICESGEDSYGSCPIYFLYNWRWIKSHLAEVGAVTSSILVRPSLFSYDIGVYSSKLNLGTPIEPPDDILGMLDVTIIGWGQTKVNMTIDDNNDLVNNHRWWYVIPHFGWDFGLKCSDLFDLMTDQGNPNDIDDHYYINDNRYPPATYVQLKSNGQLNKENNEKNPINGFTFLLGNDGSENIYCGPNDSGNSKRTGIMMFLRRFDDSSIESQAVGAVPYNFIPKPWRTPAATWSLYTPPTPYGESAAQQEGS